ncbi:hypothetical protein DQE84_14245 [Staphylococcus warneri]|nr:hypothetical protein DQE84_14245 [Staphylococcus warneri]
MSVDVVLALDVVYVLLVELGCWWNSVHIYSGDVRNMGLEVKVGGCFCEIFFDKGGQGSFCSIEYVWVIYAVLG